MPMVCDDLEALVENGSVVFDEEKGHYVDRGSGISMVDWRDAVNRRHILSFDGEDDLYPDDDIPDGPPEP